MAGETVVFFPKHTTLVGNGAIYYSDPYDVTSYKSIAFEVNFIAAIGSGTISAQLQESSDLSPNSFSDIGSAVAPSAGAIDGTTVSDPARYVRLKMTVSGASGVVTLYAKGVARDG